MSTPACRACGSTRLQLKGRKPGTFIRREFDFLTCQDCGLIFVEPFSGFEIYNDAYYRGEGPDPYVDYAAEYHDWTRSDRVLEFADLVRLAEQGLRDQKTKGPRDPESNSTSPQSPSLPLSLSPSLPPLRWLDFGCGAGAFLKYLRTLGSLQGRPLDLTGHDVGSYASLLKTKDGFRILDLDELRREPDASYDVISMIEVLEHLPAPLEPLQLVARLLKPGGRLLLTTGNLASPVARRQGIHYRYCAPEIHVSLFDPPSLAGIYRRAGLEPQFVRYHGAVKFKVLKTLRHRPALRAVASLALRFPPVVRLIDHLYGVSAMPCAVKA
jgi:2-polyprenyl-3-methyl-5-hydroxy-6-metoxy-1,4-benzoquinol methylase